MPATTANQYSSGKIYKLINPDFPDEIYIGATTEKYLCKVLNNKRVFLDLNPTKKYSYDKLINGKEDIILIENFPCGSKDELRARQQHYIDLNRSKCVNDNKRNVGIANRETQYTVNEKTGNISGKFHLARINCDICECTYTLGNGGKHKATKKHINNEKKLKEKEQTEVEAK